MAHDSPGAEGDSYARMASAIRSALGLSACALLAGGCGGKAIIDGSLGEAGSGGSATTSSTLSTTTTLPGCHPALPDPSFSLASACPLSPVGASCPNASDPSVFTALSSALDTNTCGDFCCTSVSVTSVPCGPELGPGNLCCYTAMMHTQEVCEGRPFVVEGRVRRAEPAERADWCDRALLAALAAAPDAIRALSERDRAAVSSAWLSDALDEHASIASFARFTLELMALGAPPDLVASAVEAGEDEVRHAEVCFALASAYGSGKPLGPSELAVDGALAEDIELASVAFAAALEGCIGETLNALVMTEAAASCSDLATRAELARIAADEGRHAELAWRTVAWAVRLDPSLCAALSARFEGARPPEPRDDVHLPAHGRIGAAARLAIYERGLAEVVRPCARSLFAAGAPAATHDVGQPS